MSELVRDPLYKRYLQTKPELPPVMRSKKMMSSPPWVVYVQKKTDGPWGKKEFWKYSEAFNFLKKALKHGVHDAALNCKRMGFEPPLRFARIRGKYVVGSDGIRRQATKPVYWTVPVALQLDQPDHYWCMYCRRPTVFKYFTSHKRLKRVDNTVRRCTICGASERIALLPTERKR